MGGLGGYNTAIAMVAIQFIAAVTTILTRPAFLHGLSPRIFVVYRQAIASLLLAPIAYLLRRKNDCRPTLGFRSFSWIFLASLIGIAVSQNAYFEGLYLANSTIASAISNLVPAVTFAMAAIFGLEKVNIRRMGSVAKILGTVICVTGAISMALLKGSKRLNTEFLPIKSGLGLEGDNHWLLGCLFLFASSCCWAFWIILQVPVSANCPDHLLSSSWMSFLGMIQAAIFALIIERNPESWILHSNLEYACCFIAGIGSALNTLGQAWCISQRGPLFCAMFSPLCLVIVTILAAIFLHEEIYAGSLVGSFAVIFGLYLVMWGKAKDVEDIKPETNVKPENDQARIVMDENSEKKSKNDLEEPLLLVPDKSNNVETR